MFGFFLKICFRKIKYKIKITPLLAVNEESHANLFFRLKPWTFSYLSLDICNLFFFFKMFLIILLKCKFTSQKMDPIGLWFFFMGLLTWRNSQNVIIRICIFLLIKCIKKGEIILPTILIFAKTQQSHQRFWIHINALYV